jgi:hypothetical protein
MTDQELDALIDTGTKIFGIDINPDWRPAIRLHLTISLGHAATVLAADIPDHTDPAPVFQA